jgi:ferric-dicitrate binding protein FerR (iron transport regulator)
MDFVKEAPNSARARGSMSGGSVDEKVELLREAEEWEHRIAQSDPASLKAFAEWIRASPSHVQACLAQLTIDTELKDIDAVRALDLERLLAEAFRSR